MNKEEFYILNSLYNGSKGRAKCTSDIECNKALSNMKLLRKLAKTGLISLESYELTTTGLDALEPYKVNNAVI